MFVSVGFRACGIYPFDPSVIPEEAFLPSSVTDNRYTGDVSPIGPVNPLVNTQEQNLDPSPTNVSQVNLSTSSHVSPAHSAGTPIVPPATNSAVTPMPIMPENNLPSSDLRSILRTPTINKTVRKRARAINCRAVVINKRLFENKNEEENDFSDDSGSDSSVVPKKPPKRQFKKLLSKKLKKINKLVPKKKTKVKNKAESWYCFICQEDRILSMRLCPSCQKYMHEECMGLTSGDEDANCPECMP